jgi:hypothetical protein
MTRVLVTCLALSLCAADASACSGGTLLHRGGLPGRLRDRRASAPAAPACVPAAAVSVVPVAPVRVVVPLGPPGRPLYPPYVTPGPARRLRR